ncbi:MAG: D-tyrosyl-tRNA(Tyr) deacylase [Enterocloster asparagiformis]|nr:D-tyrosyl-tRNA(Tyr) deacylase [Enterocloster asparagiformis]
MRAVIQRVTHAGVTVDGKVLGEIGKGFLILLGVADEDTETVAERLADKICKLRIFEDENGKTNLSLADVGGELLVISQFTLYADCRKGNRPSFTRAGAPDAAKGLYEYFMERCRQYVNVVERGEFGADMKVELLNDGPFTLMLDSGDLFK